MAGVGVGASGSAYRLGGAAFVMALGAILAALLFEHLLGFEPCPLCLQQRYAYYAGLPLLFVALVLIAGERPDWAMWVLGLVTLVFAANAALGVYHAGVEWKWWPGPDTCASAGGGLKPLSGAGGVLGSLPGARIVRCDEPTGRFLWLSFAGWNVIGSLAIALAAIGAMRAALFATRSDSN